MADKEGDRLTGRALVKETSYLSAARVGVAHYLVRERGSGDVVANHIRDSRDAELFAAAEDLLSMLTEALRLMPLGTRKRAEWFVRASALRSGLLRDAEEARGG